MYRRAYPDFPWSIRRNGKECARAKTRSQADRIVVQLSKIHRHSEFSVQYEGRNISHCSEGGKAL